MVTVEKLSQDCGCEDLCCIGRSLAEELNQLLKADLSGLELLMIEEGICPDTLLFAQGQDFSYETGTGNGNGNSERGDSQAEMVGV